MEWWFPGERETRCKSSDLQDEKVQEICFTTMWIYLSPNCTLQKSEDGKFYVTWVVFFPQ